MKKPDCKYLTSYNTMVKSGEIYYSDKFDFDDNGFLTGKSDRPRNICVPSKTGCGLLTFIQSLLWDNVKKALPGFI